MDIDETNSFLENIRIAQARIESENSDNVTALRRNPREITSEDRARMFR